MPPETVKEALPKKQHRRETHDNETQTSGGAVSSGNGKFLEASDGLLSKPQIKDPSLYLNRELSWLAFNHRVLSEAASADWPLLERLKFFAIYFSNLDEFFMIRVSALHEQNAALGAALTENRSGTGTYLSALQDQNATSGIDKSPDGLTPGQQLSRIGAEVRNQLQEAAALLSGTLLSAMEANGIYIHRWETLSKESRELAHAYFR